MYIKDGSVDAQAHKPLTIETIQEKCAAIFKTHNILKAGIFGSVITGTQTVNSDVDFVLTFKQAPSLFQLGQIKAELEAALGRSCDVLTAASLEADSGELSKKIQNEVHIIYAEPKLSA